MPISVQYEPSPGPLAQIGYLSGKSAADKRRRSELEALLERERQRQFQFGLQQNQQTFEAGQQQARFQNQQALQRGSQTFAAAQQAKRFKQIGGLQTQAEWARADLETQQQQGLDRRLGLSLGVRQSQFDTQRFDALEEGIAAGTYELSPAAQQKYDDIRQAQDDLLTTGHLGEDTQQAYDTLEAQKRRLVSNARPKKNTTPSTEDLYSDNIIERGGKLYQRRQEKSGGYFLEPLDSGQDSQSWDAYKMKWTAWNRSVDSAMKMTAGVPAKPIYKSREEAIAAVGQEPQFSPQNSPLGESPSQPVPASNTGQVQPINPQQGSGLQGAIEAARNGDQGAQDALRRRGIAW